jgi:hypothetical protein
MADGITPEGYVDNLIAAGLTDRQIEERIRDIAKGPTRAGEIERALAHLRKLREIPNVDPPTLPQLEPRPDLERATDWRAIMFKAPGGVFAWGIGLPELEAPACITHGKDSEGAKWIARRLARAAQLENQLEGMLVSLASAIAQHAGGPVAIDARDLYIKTHHILTFGEMIARVEGRGATEEGQG